MQRLGKKNKGVKKVITKEGWQFLKDSFHIEGRIMERINTISQHESVTEQVLEAASGVMKNVITQLQNIMRHPLRAWWVLSKLIPSALQERATFANKNGGDTESGEKNVRNREYTNSVSFWRKGRLRHILEPDLRPSLHLGSYRKIQDREEYDGAEDCFQVVITTLESLTKNSYNHML